MWLINFKPKISWNLERTKIIFYLNNVEKETFCLVSIKHDQGLLIHEKKEKKKKNPSCFPLPSFHHQWTCLKLFRQPWVPCVQVSHRSKKTVVLGLTALFKEAFSGIWVCGKRTWVPLNRNVSFSLIKGSVIQQCLWGGNGKTNHYISNMRAEMSS